MVEPLGSRFNLLERSVGQTWGKPFCVLPISLLIWADS